MISKASLTVGYGRIRLYGTLKRTVTMKIETRYIADDGEIFYSYADCAQYERRMKKLEALGNDKQERSVKHGKDEHTIMP